MTAKLPAGFSIYQSCDHVKKPTPAIHIDEQTVKKIADRYDDVLPLFEASIFDQLHMKHYSLRTNEKINCCWNAYVNNFHIRVFSPFEFPNHKHFRFNKNTIRYLPNESTKPSRYKLIPGPGVDFYGQLPIPQDMMMKRERAANETIKNTVKTTTKNKTKGRNATKKSK